MGATGQSSCNDGGRQGIRIWSSGGRGAIHPSLLTIFFFFFFFTFYLFNFHFFLFLKKKLKLFFESMIKIESCFLQLLILTIHKNYIKCNTLISICLQYTCFGSAFSFEHKKMKMNLMAVLVHVHCKKYWVGKIAINS